MKYVFDMSKCVVDAGKVEIYVQGAGSAVLAADSEGFLAIAKALLRCAMDDFKPGDSLSLDEEAGVKGGVNFVITRI
ncbi:hypothetical protein [Desulfobaculum sp.]